MASTYTANVGIEKIGAGEQAGTWGSTTNTNFDIVDRAINGVGAINLGSAATYNLTTSDGTLSEGHYKVLVFLLMLKFLYQNQNCHILIVYLIIQLLRKI